MATTGYKITPTLQTIFEHTNNRHCFRGPKNTWWMVAQDNTSSDWALWEWDGTFPTVGTAGGWTRADDAAGGFVYVDTRGSARPHVIFESGAGSFGDGRLHVLNKQATEYYEQWDYDSADDDWTQAVSNEDAGVSNAEEAGFVLDSNNVPWVIYYDATPDVECRYRSGGSWASDTQIASSITGTVGTNVRIDAFNWVDDDGDNAIGVIYVDGLTWRFTSKKDSDTLGSASWSTPVTIYTASSNGDDHVSAQAALFGSDTTSTIIVVLKDGDSPANLMTVRRDPDGTWDTAVEHSDGDHTQPKVVLDTTNETAYLFVPGFATGTGVRMEYYTADATTTLSWSTATTVIEDDGVNTFRAEIAVPSHTCDSNTNIMVAAERSGGSDRVWWNEVDIAALPGAGGPRGPLGHPLHGAFGGPIGAG